MTPHIFVFSITDFYLFLTVLRYTVQDLILLFYVPNYVSVHELCALYCPAIHRPYQMNVCLPSAAETNRLRLL